MACGTCGVVLHMRSMSCMRAIRSGIATRGPGIPPLGKWRYVMWRAHIDAYHAVIAWTDTVIYNIHTSVPPACSYLVLSRPKVLSPLSCATELRLQVISRSTRSYIADIKEVPSCVFVGGAVSMVASRCPKKNSNALPSPAGHHEMLRTVGSGSARRIQRKYFAALMTIPRNVSPRIGCRKNQCLRDNIANMHQTNANWQGQLGGDMHDIARGRGGSAHQAARMVQHADERSTSSRNIDPGTQLRRQLCCLLRSG